MTRWPTLTRKAASAGSSTSTLEPNLMRPTRWPRSTVLALAEVEDDAPSQKAGNLLEGDLDALRRCTVTTFCSLCSAEAGFMAFRYCPFR